jgi:hypothetical protein
MILKHLLKKQVPLLEIQTNNAHQQTSCEHFIKGFIEQ